MILLQLVLKNPEVEYAGPMHTAHSVVQCLRALMHPAHRPTIEIAGVWICFRAEENFGTLSNYSTIHFVTKLTYFFKEQI